MTFENGAVIATDYVLFAGGRVPNVEKIGLENTDVKLDDRVLLQWINIKRQVWIIFLRWAM